ncbi:MAG TPA: sigma-54 dependent transcriptional regulator [Gemmatimonadales bacterium]|nr:sigma-54 dependent transcriptional regulator [Gemmatimonadales bacterium]
MTRVLIIDDDPGLRRSLGLLLGEAGYTVVAEGDPARALELAQADPFDLILCDVRMPGLDGREFLRRYRAAGGAALVVVMSAYGSEDAALEVIREGAYDYLHKPFRPDEVLFTLRKAEERERLRREVAELRATVAGGAAGGGLVVESPAMRRVVELASRVAGHATTVLLTGESGTGKEVIARLIHQRSPRAAERFVAVNCAAIPEALIESELFGHVRGSFTGATGDRRGLFEEADRGTLLLDEIGDLPFALQPKLLRALEEGAIRRVGEASERKVDVRVIAATARPLDELVRDGRFREDLFYRLNVVQLALPPLRDRPEDIPALAAHFLAQAGARLGRPLSLSPDALGRLHGYRWPGNVRELRNVIERAAVLAPSSTLDAGDFLLGDTRGSAPAGTTDSLKPQVEAIERAAIARALAGADGNRRAAAKALGVSLRTLFYKIRRYGLE